MGNTSQNTHRAEGRVEKTKYKTLYEGLDYDSSSSAPVSRQPDPPAEDTTPNDPLLDVLIRLGK